MENTNTAQYNILQYAEVPFYQDKILSVHVQSGEEKTIFVPVRALCEILGLAKQIQIVKIKADEVLIEGSIEITLPTSGGNQKAFCLRYDLVPMWLTTIHPRKVKPEYRDKILLYRKKVAKVLADYFLKPNKGIVEQIAQEFEAAANFAMRFGLEGNHALLAAAKAIHKIYNQDALALLEINLISAEQEKLWIATELARRAALKSSREVNKMLERKGMLSSYRDHKERLCWKLTEKASKEKYGVYVDTGKKHSDGMPVQQIKWYEKVLKVLQE